MVKINGLYDKKPNAHHHPRFYQPAPEPQKTFESENDTIDYTKILTLFPLDYFLLLLYLIIFAFVLLDLWIIAKMTRTYEEIEVCEASLKPF